MPNLVIDLDVDRVDVVDEGANSASFIELYKRKEKPTNMDVKEILSKMKPEHASVIEAAISKAKEDLDAVTAERDTAQQDLAKAKEDLAAANSELAGKVSEIETLKAKGCTKKYDEESCKGCDKRESCKKASSGTGFDEEETMKSMPESVREVFAKMKAQRDAAEEELRKSKEAEQQAEAVAKAAQLKALPVESEKLVSVIKGCSADMLDVLSTINAAIEGTVLTEVGKSASGITGADAWSKIEVKAEEIAKRDGITKQKAVAIAVKENPDLYKDYLQGGAN